MARPRMLLRARRLGTGNGRFYLIRITATDAYGNTSDLPDGGRPEEHERGAHRSIEAEAAAAQSACTAADLFVVGD
jgi:hypothetical protein